MRMPVHGNQGRRRLDSSEGDPQMKSRAAFPSIFSGCRAPLGAYTRRMLCKGWSVVLVLMLSACAHTDDYQRPPLPVSMQWPAGLDVTGTENAARISWQSFFADPRLQALIGAALQNNRDMRIAIERVREARAEYKATDADRFPTVSLNGSASIGQTPADLSGNGTVINGQRYDLATTSVSYEVDFWGRLASLSEAAKRSYLATNEARRAYEISLIGEVASAYFNLLQVQAQMDMARESLSSQESSLAVVAQGQAIGAAGDYEYQQVRADVENARAEFDAVVNQYNAATNKLNYLVGDVPQNLPPGRDLDHQGLDAALAPGLPSDVLLQRPDIAGAEQRLRAAHANVAAARAAFMPQLTLTTSAGVASAALSTLFNGAAWSFEPLLALPLFDAGRREANQDIAEARKVIAVAEYEKAIQQAFREVSDLLSTRAMLVHQVRSAQINEAAQARRLEIVLARYHVGLVNVLDVLDGQRRLVAAQQTTMQVRRAQLDAATQLFKALGGSA